MRLATMILALAAGACAGDGGPPPASALDGTYRGTAQALAGCHPARSFDFTTTVAGGVLVIPFPNGTSIGVPLAADGTLARIAHTEQRFTATGDGRIAEGALSLDLTTFDAVGNCRFRYTGTRVA